MNDGNSKFGYTDKKPNKTEYKLAYFLAIIPGVGFVALNDCAESIFMVKVEVERGGFSPPHEISLPARSKILCISRFLRLFLWKNKVRPDSMFRSYQCTCLRGGDSAHEVGMAYLKAAPLPPPHEYPPSSCLSSAQWKFRMLYIAFLMILLSASLIPLKDFLQGIQLGLSKIGITQRK